MKNYITLSLIFLQFLMLVVSEILNNLPCFSFISLQLEN